MMERFLMLIAFFTLMGCTPGKKITVTQLQKVEGVTAVSKNMVAPVFIRENFNPLFNVRVAITGTEAVELSDLRIQLNAHASENLDSLRLYLTGNTGETNFQRMTYLGMAKFDGKETGSAAAPSARLSPSAAFPFNTTLYPGVYNFWVTASVKAGSNIDQMVKVTPLSLQVNERPFAILEINPNNGHRIGIAIRQRWDENIHTYRIPGITETNNGTLLAVYDNRYTTSGDLPANIDVGMSRSTDGGQTWEPMKVIMDMGAPHENNGIGDPAILFDKNTNTVWVAALWSKGNNSIRDSRPGLSPDSSGQFVLVKSTDDGKTWSEPINITEQVKNPIWHLYFNGPGNGIVMEDGTLVFPSQYWDENKMPHSTVIYSKDQGKTWHSGIGAKSNTTEAQVVETTPGTLMLNMRDNRGRYRSVATTTDLGKTWTEHPTSYSALIDPVCMASIIKMKTNSVDNVLFFSNVADMHARKNMTIKYSNNLGEAWNRGMLIDERNQYGYSVLTPVGEDKVGLLWEGLGNLYFIRVPVSEIRNSNSFLDRVNAD